MKGYILAFTTLLLIPLAFQNCGDFKAAGQFSQLSNLSNGQGSALKSSSALIASIPMRVLRIDYNSDTRLIVSATPFGEVVLSNENGAMLDRLLLNESLNSNLMFIENDLVAITDGNRLKIVSTQLNKLTLIADHTLPFSPTGGLHYYNGKLAIWGRYQSDNLYSLSTYDIENKQFKHDLTPRISVATNPSCAKKNCFFTVYNDQLAAVELYYFDLQSETQYKINGMTLSRFSFQLKAFLNGFVLTNSNESVLTYYSVDGPSASLVEGYDHGSTIGIGNTSSSSNELLNLYNGTTSQPGNNLVGIYSNGQFSIIDAPSSGYVAANSGTLYTTSNVSNDHQVVAYDIASNDQLSTGTFSLPIAKPATSPDLIARFPQTKGFSNIDDKFKDSSLCNILPHYNYGGVCIENNQAAIYDFNFSNQAPTLIQRIDVPIGSVITRVTHYQFSKTLRGAVISYTTAQQVSTTAFYSYFVSNGIYTPFNPTSVRVATGNSQLDASNITSISSNLKSINAEENIFLVKSSTENRYSLIQLNNPNTPVILGAAQTPTNSTLFDQLLRFNITYHQVADEEWVFSLNELQADRTKTLTSVYSMTIDLQDQLEIKTIGQRLHDTYQVIGPTRYALSYLGRFNNNDLFVDRLTNEVFDRDPVTKNISSIARYVLPGNIKWPSDAYEYRGHLFIFGESLPENGPVITSLHALQLNNGVFSLVQNLPTLYQGGQFMRSSLDPLENRFVLSSSSFYGLFAIDNDVLLNQ